MQSRKPCPISFFHQLRHWLEHLRSTSQHVCRHARQGSSQRRAPAPSSELRKPWRAPPGPRARRPGWRRRRARPGRRAWAPAPAAPPRRPRQAAARAAPRSACAGPRRTCAAARRQPRASAGPAGPRLQAWRARLPAQHDTDGTVSQQGRMGTWRVGPCARLCAWGFAAHAPQQGCTAPIKGSNGVLVRAPMLELQTDSSMAQHGQACLRHAEHAAPGAPGPQS